MWLLMHETIPPNSFGSLEHNENSSPHVSLHLMKRVDLFRITEDEHRLSCRWTNDTVMIIFESMEKYILLVSEFFFPVKLNSKASCAELHVTLRSWDWRKNIFMSYTLTKFKEITWFELRRWLVTCELLAFWITPSQRPSHWADYHQRKEVFLWWSTLKYYFLAFYCLD